MYTISLEATAWLRATAVGVVLPAEVQERREHLERIEAGLAALPTAVEVKTADEFLTEGMDPAKAQAKASKLAEEAAALEEAQRIARAGVGGAQFNLSRTVARYRDELILSIRPLLATLLDEVRPLADKLREFAPAFSPTDIVNSGTAEHLEAYQASREHETRFGMLLAAHRASFKAEASMPGACVDVREVDAGFQYWADPSLVRNDALAGRKLNRFGHPVAPQPDALNVALETEAEFRPATLGEMAAIFAGQLRQNAEARPMGRTRRGWVII